MNYNELYEILKENFEKEGDFKVIKDLNLTIETIAFQSKKADLLNGSFCETSCEKHHANFKENNEKYILYGFPAIDSKDFDIERRKFLHATMRRFFRTLDQHPEETKKLHQKLCKLLLEI